jgi:hypothetical protein
LRTRLLLLLAVLGSAACQGTRKLSDPTLLIRTSAGKELGVSTDHGIVFLGQTAVSGDVDVTAWFGDGPSIERSVIEPVGGGLYTAEMEIRLPSVPLSFRKLRKDDEVLIVGRRGNSTWETRARVRVDPRVDGLLLSIPGELRNAPDQVGAGVYVVGQNERTDRHLIGLVSGTLELVAPDGARKSFLTVVGPDTLWRLVARRKELERKRRWVYREDVL